MSEGERVCSTDERPSISSHACSYRTAIISKGIGHDEYGVGVATMAAGHTG